MNAVTRFKSSLALIAVLALGACGDDPSVPNSLGAPQFNSVEPPSVKLIKLGPTGTTATFTITATGGSLPLGSTVTLNACTPDAVTVCSGQIVWLPTGSGVVSVTVTETGTTGGTVFDQIAASSGLDGSIGVFAPAAPTVTVHVNDANGAVIRFKNLPGQSFIPGRMTGGGGQIVIGDMFISRGFTIHCDITLSNNIEINWPDNKWHLDKPITSALCIDDPTISPVPPDAPFDTFIGTAVGRLNGVDGALLRFIFVDDGERGGPSHDQAQIQIWDANGNLVLNVPLSLLDRGNIQAHYDQPHK